MASLFIHDFIPATAVEGPGLRACLWVQGCSIRCHDCMVPHTWDRKKGKEVSVETLASDILAIEGIEGLTVLGGEPMEQAEALLPLLQIIKNSGLSLMLFSGYTKEQLLESNCPSKKAIIDLCDIFVDGPYQKENTDFSRPWVGSSNQRIYFQTDRYKHLENQLDTIHNKVELRIAEDGTVKVNGMLSKEKFIEIRQLVKDL